jgi:hypothetical protein
MREMHPGCSAIGKARNYFREGPLSFQESLDSFKIQGRGFQFFEDAIRPINENAEGASVS